MTVKKRLLEGRVGGEVNTYIHTYFICHKVKVWQHSLMWTSSTTKQFKNKLKIY